MNYIMKKDRKLKHAAEKIFGPIVKNAWVATYEYRDDSKLDQRKSLNRISSDIIDKNGNINMGIGRVSIEFENGKKVVFWASEWGGVIPMGKEFKDIDE